MWTSELPKDVGRLGRGRSCRYEQRETLDLFYALLAPNWTGVKHAELCFRLFANDLETMKRRTDRARVDDLSENHI